MTCESTLLKLNGHELVLRFRDNITQHSFQVTTAGRTVGLTVQGYCDRSQSGPTTASRHVVFFDVNPQDGTRSNDFPSFTALLDHSAQDLTLVIPHPSSNLQCLSSSDELAIASNFFSTEDDQPLEPNDDEPETTDVFEESSEDTTVKDLRRRFTQERQLIRRLTMDCNRERKQLFDELHECKHDIKCSSKALCQHFHNVFVDLIASLRSHLESSPMVSNDRYQAIEGSEKDFNYETKPPYVDSPSSGFTLTSTTPDQKNVIVHALEILAGVLGITVLISLIRRHFRSVRGRVDQLADREERRRAREYRRLARKEAVRKRWARFKGFFRFPCRKGACEEKHSLILEAAAPALVEQGRLGDVEQAWDAVWRANPDQLMAGLEQFASNYRAVLGEASNSNHRSSAKNSDARSSSSSLPSYDSEKLPEYTSQPGDQGQVVQGYRMYARSLTDCSSSSGITPDSSIPDLSPRCSRDTLRTVISRD